MNDGYPASWETDVVLRDGHTVHVRPIQPDDAAGLADFHGRQSAESVYFRFLSPRPRLSDRELRYFTEIDYVDRMAFVAELDDQLVAVARYERYSGSDTAEVAFFVDDAHHGRGLATVMLEYLAAAAQDAGVETPLDYAIFQDHGYKGLYGGLGAKDIHAKKGLKKSHKILDYMGSTELAANLFRATQAEEKLRRDNIQGKQNANKTHFEVGQKVRQTIGELGGTMPENLPTPDKSVKQVENEQKKLGKQQNDDSDQA